MDIGSTAPVMLPPQPKSRTPLLAVQGGKDGVLRLLNRRRLGGVGGELQDVGGDGLYSTPAVWTDSKGTTWIFEGTESSVRALRVETDAQGRTTLVSAWKSPVAATSPVVANGVVFIAGDDNVRALDARNGGVLWTQPIGGIHWQSPTVVNGMVYISDESSKLVAFGL
jgi:outer membrane protein assembly factor BamB